MSKAERKPSNSVSTISCRRSVKVAAPDLGAATLMDLPPELHLLISSHLIYPDALSLKHTNRHFYDLVFTGVNLKIDWLLERRKLHLDCPNDKKCELGSDMRFCRGSVSLLMKRRREHGECDAREGGRGCLVFGTKTCAIQKQRMGILPTTKRWLRVVFVESTILLWLLLALAGCAIAWGWNEMRRMEKMAEV